MDKKLQVFISSTYEDLKDERQSAVLAILKMNHIPAGMELFTADNKEQMDVIKHWIDESDVFMLILGGRYGSVCTETGFSYTHMEYNYAKAIGKPTLVLVMKDALLNSKKAFAYSNNLGYLYESDNDKYIAFKKSIMESGIVGTFDNIDQMVNVINTTLHGMQNDAVYNFTGWVKGKPKKTESSMLADEKDDTKLAKRVENFQPQVSKNLIFKIICEDRDKIVWDAIINRLLSNTIMLKQALIELVENMHYDHYIFLHGYPVLAKYNQVGFTDFMEELYGINIDVFQRIYDENLIYDQICKDRLNHILN